MFKLTKRLFDFILSAVVFIILTPLLIPIMIGLKLTGEGYIFYKQERIGLNREYFYILKFATMLKDSPNIGTGSITLRNDPRITPMGGFLRKTKINELPQIFNILKGDISIVGPRPLVDKTFNAYPADIQEKVYNVKPGLTGIGSIVFRDEEALVSGYDGDPHEFYKDKIAPYKGELEMWYQRNTSFLLDLKLIFLTAWVVMFSNSNLPFKLLKDLPERPEFIKKV